ncbi:invasion associated locus B family protein [Microvirga arsenatis]|uniref:Invasion associated locus B family protein n=1 Tax=Microvirga arsenatis TaxID=2692265 RepID=A0ABW9Z2P5_9HYPH|nr:invasion associated locus B family protein [Microvirga arsenatis]NBJ12659.1 invasion associated locus B family protein [Microvirga arsenatis]NBJ26593.1 invasion associated locus B family protein [Microvirga arsenatis]
MPLTLRLALSVTAAALAFGPLPGLAQTNGQAQKPQQPAPKAQPAKPQPAQPGSPQAAQPGRPQAAQPQGAGPVVVALKPEPLQPEWTKVCGKDQGANAEVCYTTRDFVTDKGQRIVAVALYDSKAKGAPKTVRVLVPLGFLVPPGVRMVVDKSPPVPGRFTACLPHGCFVEAAVKDDFVTAFKKGSTLNVSARNQIGREVSFTIPVAGFAKAFDGPPVDPKVLAEQQKKLQEELQKRSEEARGQRMGNFGAPGGTPAATPGAAAPKN